MSIENIKFLFCSCLICIVASAFLFPAYIDSTHPGLYKIGDLLGQVKNFRKISDFPAALVMTYLVTVVFGYGMAIIIIFSKEMLRPAIKYVCNHGKFRCLWIGGILTLVCVYIIFFDSGLIHSSGRRGALFQKIPISRFCLAYWCSAIFIMSVSSIVFFIFAVFSFFSREDLSD